MVKPVIFAVDDEPEVLRAIERDLRRHFGNAFRIVRAGSGQIALDAVRQLKLRNEPVALFLSDQRMPQMSGVEFLSEARRIFPEAKCALLTAYADTEAAIKAINEVKLDYYLMKPWDPPEENLYPVLTDLLDDWLAEYRPPFSGVRLIGHRWSPRSHQLKDFLARNQVMYQWLDVDASAEARQHLASLSTNDLPVMIFPNGTVLNCPTQAEVAEKIGLRTQAEMPFYDLAIVGGGPAGLAAGVYGASEGLRTVLIERHAPGGQAGTSSRIENYLGFPVGLSGSDLTRRAVTQARRFGVEILAPQEVVSLRCADPYRLLTLADGSQINCYAVIVATGVAYKTLSVPGIERLTGAGVYYGAALTEAIACRDEEVFVVGGANSAGQAAMHFSKYARKVTMLVRADSLTKSMSQYLIDQIAETPNIEVRVNAEVSGVGGEDRLETIEVRDATTGIETVHPANSLFIFIGAEPNTDWLDASIQRDERGFILAGPDLVRNGKRPAGWTRDPFLLETSLSGVFVAGDVRSNSVKRVASAVGQGSIAVQFVHQYLAMVR